MDFLQTIAIIEGIALVFVGGALLAVLVDKAKNKKDK